MNILTDSILSDNNGGITGGSSSIVTFHNNLYIADNGNDTTGDGSLSNPYLTGNKTQTVIAASSPSATNLFYVHDMRTSSVSEDLKFMPFVKWVSEGKTNFSGDLALHSLFNSITTDSWSWWEGYRQYDGTKTLTIDFSTKNVAHQIIIDLVNSEKCPMTYPIIGNDNVNNLNGITFIVNETNFNTAGTNGDGSFWRANCTMISGVTRRIRYTEGWQLSSIKVSQGSVTNLTWLDVAYCGFSLFQSSSATLDFINTGGVGESFLQIDQRFCSAENTSGNFNLDITNDGVSQATIYFDNSVFCRINSFNSLNNISFVGEGIGDYLLSQFAPVNFTPTDFTPSGAAPVSAGNNAYGSYLNGIDIKLGTLQEILTRNGIV